MNAAVDSSGGWPGDIFDMPDLGDLDLKLSVTQMLNRRFAGGGPKDPSTYALTMNFVRLTVKAVSEYNEAREAGVAYWRGSNEDKLDVSLLDHVHGCFEDCFSALALAIQFARRIRRRQHGPPVPKKVAVLSDGVFKRVSGVRNSIQHWYERLLKDGYVSGEPVCLVMRASWIELSGDTVRYDELGCWLREPHDIANQMAGYREP